MTDEDADEDRCNSRMLEIDVVLVQTNPHKIQNAYDRSGGAVCEYLPSVALPT